MWCVHVVQLQGSHAEDLNRNPVLMSIGAIFLVWLTFGFSVWYAFYATLVAGIAGGLSLLTGNASSLLLVQGKSRAAVEYMFCRFFFCTGQYIN